MVIQGFGNVGSNAARLMRRRGYKVVGVSTSKGGVYNKEGLDIEALVSTTSAIVLSLDFLIAKR